MFNVNQGQINSSTCISLSHSFISSEDSAQMGKCLPCSVTTVNIFPSSAEETVAFDKSMHPLALDLLGVSTC